MRQFRQPLNVLICHFAESPPITSAALLVFAGDCPVNSIAPRHRVV
jgi:hypothetical protein